ncbi:diaminopimelate decarboxylase family protein [Actinoplanes sp. G11-F43]|uniref:diaminopimelate decarboxylase family protein n=1 Tax=Actinoplanes sp. G11-F43 TaxID=3424130 RepID=UPI003D358B01
MTLADLLPTLRTSMMTRHLDPRHWPSTVRWTGDGELSVGGLRLSRLAAEHGTPVHVLDETSVRSAAAGYAEAFGGGTGCAYSAKAGLSRVSGKWIADAGLGCYTGSAEQLRIALAAGFPAQRLVLSGGGKSIAALDAAFERGAAVVAGSAAEVMTLIRRAPAGQRVLVRVIPSGHRCPRRYGVRLGGTPALDVVGLILASPNLRLSGLDCSLGHDLARFGTFERCLREAIGFSAVIRARHRAGIDLINLGGGQAGELPADVFASRMRGVARVNAERYGIPVPLVRVSPGHALIARAGVTVCRVERVTRTGGRLVVLLDGDPPAGNGHAALLGRISGAAPEPATLEETSRAGTVGKGTARVIAVPGDLVPGDLLVLAGTGADQRSPRIVGRPALIAVAEGLARTLVRRGTVADMLTRIR